MQRFDANSYLTITRALDYFDVAADHDGDLSRAFKNCSTRFCVVSFSSDWLFPTSQSRALARALNKAGVNVSFVEIESDRGHDAFLLDEPDFERTIRGFLEGPDSIMSSPESHMRVDQKFIAEHDCAGQSRPRYWQRGWHTD